MSDFQKARIIMSAAYRSGDVLMQDKAVPARVRILPIPGAEKFRELNLRIVVDSRDSEELLEGITRGTVFITVEQMLSVIERSTNKDN